MPHDFMSTAIERQVQMFTEHPHELVDADDNILIGIDEYYNGEHPVINGECRRRANRLRRYMRYLDQE